MKIKEIQYTAFDDEHSVQDMHIVDLIPNVMGRVTISERGGEHYLFIPPEMDSMNWRKWLSTAAGVFSKDFLAWLREKADAKYMLVKSATYKTAIRLITKDELLLFETNKLINGKIKDSYYMHLKTVGINDNIHGHERYIKEKDVVDPDRINEKETENDDKNHSYHSESLFE